jgi:hypothetical protein
LEANAESGSCCYRTPKRASPAGRAPTSNSDPQDTLGCGSAALRYALVTHSSRYGLRPFVRDSGFDAERGKQGDNGGVPHPDWPHVVAAGVSGMRNTHGQAYADRDYPLGLTKRPCAEHLHRWQIFCNILVTSVRQHVSWPSLNTCYFNKLHRTSENCPVGNLIALPPLVDGGL